jgi:dihydroxyacetone kinase-like predicted kinase
VELEQQRAEEQEEAFKKMKLERKVPTVVEETKPAAPPKKYGFIAVSAGEGMERILKEIGVDHVISGGQTMNPSTEDILKAAQQVNAETIYVLPNNKNIVLAANQAASIMKEKRVIVIPTKTVPQGISAMLAFSEGVDALENQSAMVEAAASVKTGEVTFSVRDTSVEGKSILKGDIMGIDDNGISAIGPDIREVTEKLIDGMVDDDSGLITVYYGVDTVEEDALSLKETLEEKYPDAEVDLQNGGQPIYYYIISVE